MVAILFPSLASPDAWSKPERRIIAGNAGGAPPRVWQIYQTPLEAFSSPAEHAFMNLYQAADRSAPARPRPRTAATSFAATSLAATDFSATDFAATGLLVSVRSVAEAAEIAPLAIDVIDLKEPLRGPLGACDPEVWHRSLAECEFAGEWSAALGEAGAAIPWASEVPPEFSFAKAGPAGIDRRARLGCFWEDLRRRLPPAVALVAVAYADWSAASTLPPEQVLEVAIRTGLGTLLIDTFGKDGRSSVEHLSFARLQRLVARAKDANCEVVLAGGATFEALATFARLGVRRVGVRGGVCQAGRESRLDSAAVERWAKQLAKLAQGRSEPSTEPSTPQ